MYLDEGSLKQAFEYFDKDGSGKITYDELLMVLNEENPIIGEDEVKQMIEEVDIDRDGAVDYEEFINMMQKNKH